MNDDMTKRRYELADRRSKRQCSTGNPDLDRAIAWYLKIGFEDGWDACQSEMQEQVDELKKELNTSKMLKDLYHKSSIKFELELKKFNRFADFVSNDEEIAVIEKERDTLKQQLEISVKALEFYAPSNSYDYDKTQGMNYIWNDQGKQARQALTQIKELQGSPSGIADREESK